MRLNFQLPFYSDFHSDKAVIELDENKKYFYILFVQIVQQYSLYSFTHVYVLHIYVYIFFKLLFHNHNIMNYILQQQYKESGEQPETMSRKEAAMFPFISSFTLVGLYIVYKVFTFVQNKIF